VVGTVGKPSAKRGAWSFFRGVPIYNGKVIEFQKNYMNKKIRKLLSLTFCLWQRHTGTLVLPLTPERPSAPNPASLI